MAHSISLNRRRTGLIELSWPERQGVTSYLLKAATTFSGTFTTVATIPTYGLISKSLQAVQTSRMETASRGRTRIIFSPTDYSLDDTKDIWVRVAPISAAGATGADEAIHLIQPYNTQANRVTHIQGQIPIQSSIANSLELNVPGQCNPTIQNDGAGDIYVAFESNGMEFKIPPLTSGFTNYVSFKASFNQLFLRSVTSISTVYISSVTRNESL